MWSSTNKTLTSIVKLPGMATNRGTLYLTITGGALAALIYATHKISDVTAKYNNKLTWYMCGISTGIAAVLASRIYRIMMLPSPNRVLKEVLPVLRANLEVRQNLGGELKIGLFKAYAYAGGLKFRKPYTSNWRFTSPVSINNRTLQLIFQMYGEKSTAMVSLEVPSRRIFNRKSTSQYSNTGYKYLAVDFINGERLLLHGDAETAQVLQGYNRY